MSVEEKRLGVEPNHPHLSIRRQCELLGLNRSTLYYEPAPVPKEEYHLLREIAEIYTRMPFYGVPRMTGELRRRGFPVGAKRVRRLMREIGFHAIYPRPNLSKPRKDHQLYPYLLRALEILCPDHVWCADITYIRLKRGFVYLMAIMDWFSRYVLSWEISISLAVEFCLLALERAFKQGLPAIFNSDQGAQFTSQAFTERLLDSGIQISMDGRGRAYDNIFIERLWRSVKYEEVYLKDYETVAEARAGVERYLDLYNNERLHQALGYKTPAAVYFGGKEVSVTA